MYGYQKQGIMTLEEAQKEVDRWIKTYGVRYFSELTNMAVLTEEVGELARVMARKYGDQSFKQGEKDNLADEMADVLWVLICLANLGGDLDVQTGKAGMALIVLGGLGLADGMLPVGSWHPFSTCTQRPSHWAGSSPGADYCPPWRW